MLKNYEEFGSYTRRSMSHSLNSLKQINEICLLKYNLDTGKDISKVLNNLIHFVLTNYDYQNDFKKFWYETYDNLYNIDETIDGIHIHKSTTISTYHLSDRLCFDISKLLNLNKRGLSKAIRAIIAFFHTLFVSKNKYIKNGDMLKNKIENAGFSIYKSWIEGDKLLITLNIDEN